MSDFPHLFSPFKIGPIKIANRICFAPNCPTLVKNPIDGVFADNAVAYYEERAKGEAGLIVIGGTYVHKSSINFVGPMPQLYDNRNIPILRRIAKACRRHGTPLFIQLWHAGQRAVPRYREEPTFDPMAPIHAVAPSQIPEVMVPSNIPKELEGDEIHELIDAYGDAAERARKAGLDGVEVLAAHGNLPWQFLSPLYNKRQDEYGGTPENRARFLVQVLNRIRDSVGKNMAVGYRISVDALSPYDMNIQDIKDCVKIIGSKTKCDFIDTSIGVDYNIAMIVGPLYVPEGYEAPYTRQLKEVSSLPIFLTGGITDPELAEKFLSEKQADVISMARQLIADPEFAKKARHGLLKEIRTCIRVNYCYSRYLKGLRIQCVQNPAIGREKIWGSGTLKKAPKPKHVLIIGGGPAGLECARVAALRGHPVRLYEKEQQVGGTVLKESRLPDRQETRKAVEWLEHQARNAGVDIQNNTPVSSEQLLALIDEEKPSVVVIATGSRPARDGFQGFTGSAVPGWGQKHVLTYEDVIENPAGRGKNVLILDEWSDIMAPAIAEMLAKNGSKVKIVTRLPAVGMELAYDLTQSIVYRRIYENGIEVVPDTFLNEIREKDVVLYNIYTGKKSVERADTVVLVTTKKSNRELYDAAKKKMPGRVFLIGDALAPRPYLQGVYSAVFEGHRLGRSL